MDISVDINADQINKAISEAIIKSAIGEQLKKAVDEQVQALSRSYDNPIKRVVEREVHTILARIITEDYGDKIRQAITGYVTDDVVADLTRKAWDAYRERY